MFRENNIKTCILSSMKQIASSGWMHETSARTWCTGKTHRDPVEREVGGEIGMGIHVTPWLIQVNVWQNPLQYCQVISLQLIKINEKKKGKLTFTLRHHFPCWIACQLWLFLGKHDYSPIIHTFKQAISATKSESNSVKNVNFTFIWREYKMPNLIPCCTAGMLWN